MDDEELRRRRTIKSESFVKTRSTSSCATPRYQWRSISWSNHSPVHDDENEATSSSSNVDGEDDTDVDMQNLCPPLQSLSVSKGSSSSGKVVRKGRNSLDIKLDLGIIEKTVPEEEPSDGDEDLHQQEAKGVEKDKHCSQISSYLFVAGRSVAQNYSVLQSYRITHILNCVGFCCPEYYPNEFHYKTLWLHDNPSEDIICVLYDVFDFLENVREQAGCQVLVHCSEGVSRSAALVIAYIMWRDRQSFEQVFERVKKIRASTNPNLGFVFQLMQWQARMLGTCSETLHMYRMAPQSAYDPLYLVPKAVLPPSLDALDSRFAFVIRTQGGLYVWRGKMCEKALAATGDRVAFQLIRYEHAHGPIVTVAEGSEPAALLEALTMAASTSKERLSNVVPVYDTDYEIYTKAKAGELRTPVRIPGSNRDMRSPSLAKS